MNIHPFISIADQNSLRMRSAGLIGRDRDASFFCKPFGERFDGDDGTGNEKPFDLVQMKSSAGIRQVAMSDYGVDFNPVGQLEAYETMNGNVSFLVRLKAAQVKGSGRNIQDRANALGASVCHPGRIKNLWIIVQKSRAVTDRHDASGIGLFRNQILQFDFAVAALTSHCDPRKYLGLRISFHPSAKRAWHHIVSRVCVVSTKITERSDVFWLSISRKGFQSQRELCNRFWRHRAGIDLNAQSAVFEWTTLVRRVLHRYLLSGAGTPTVEGRAAAVMSREQGMIAAAQGAAA